MSENYRFKISVLALGAASSVCMGYHQIGVGSFLFGIALGMAWQRTFQEAPPEKESENPHG